jgi:hypothetical protein
MVFNNIDDILAYYRAIDKVPPTNVVKRKDITPMPDNNQGNKDSEGKLNYELYWPFISAMAERMSKNKNKYQPYNWKKPMDVEKLKQSTFRHMIEVMNGNYKDEGEQMGHLTALALNSMFIYYQLLNSRQNDGLHK